MEQVKIIFDASVNSLTVWFGDPSDEDVSSQLGEDLIVMKDRNGDPIGFEKHFFAAQSGAIRVQFETLNSEIPLPDHE